MGFGKLGDKVKNLWQKIPLSTVKSFMSKKKYLITIVIFLIYMTFFDSSSFLHFLKVKRETMRLNREIATYKEEYHNDSLRLHELSYNREALERYARERYRMKEPDEVIYIVE